jgi:hypothetical protein
MSVGLTWNYGLRGTIPIFVYARTVFPGGRGRRVLVEPGSESDNTLNLADCEARLTPLPQRGNGRQGHRRVRLDNTEDQTNECLEQNFPLIANSHSRKCV